MNIEAIKRRLLIKYPLFGSVLANVNFIKNLSIRTAGTDGKNVYYNPNFIETINEDQQIFIFAHEICHIAFNHIFRSEGKDSEKWDIATDSVINASLKKDGLPMVENGIDIPEAINYDAEGMYNKLLSEDYYQNIMQNLSKTTSSYEQSKEKSTSAVGHDTHSMWDEAIIKKHQEDQNQANNKKEQSQKNQHLNSNEDEEQVKKTNENIDKLTKLGEKEVFSQNKLIRKKQLEELKEKLASQSDISYFQKNNIRKNTPNIEKSKPLIDWRRLLKETFKYDIDWSYKNAEIEYGIVTAYLEDISRPETEIVLDTSGSIDENLLRNFLRECINILPISKVKVGCFDTKFYGFTEIRDLSDIDKLTFYGGGNTNFDVAINAFSKRVENKIIFTDGKANMPSKSLNAIWVVFGETKIHPLGGKVIYIDNEQLEKLNNYQIANVSQRKTK